MRAKNQNVGAHERWISALAGGALVGFGLSSKSRAARALSLAAAAAFFARAASGRCPIYSKLANSAALSSSQGAAHDSSQALEGYERLQVTEQGTLRMRDEPERAEKTSAVEEASMESFPASDPPSWVV